MNNLYLKPRCESGSISEVRRLRRRTMRLSIAEGGIALITVSLSDAFYIPYLTAMGATIVQIALGAGLPNVICRSCEIDRPCSPKKDRFEEKSAYSCDYVSCVCFIPLALLGLLGCAL